MPDGSADGIRFLLQPRGLLLPLELFLEQGETIIDLLGERMFDSVKSRLSLCLRLPGQGSGRTKMVDLLRAYSKLPILDISSRSDHGERTNRTLLAPHAITRRLNGQEIAQLCADYEAGATARDLATSYSISKTSVQKLLQGHGITLRHHGLSDADVEKAAGLYRAGKSVAQVARFLAVSPSSVYDALKRVGVEMRHAHHTVGISLPRH